MAEGVAKSFKTHYRENLRKAMEFIAKKDISKKELKDMLAYIDKEYGEAPTLKRNSEYEKHEADYLVEHFGIDKDQISDLQNFAYNEGYKDTDRETYQAMESFLHNLNTMHSRGGGQTAFSSINFGLDTSEEGRMAMKNYLLSAEAGLGNGETAIFPISIFRVLDGINGEFGDPNYDLFQLAIRCSAKRLFPNFSFQGASFNYALYDPNDRRTEIAYMGCRTRVAANVYDPSRQITYKRGNLSFTSINLPRLAIEADHDIDKFFVSLDKTIDLVIDQLLDRMAFQSRFKARNFPFLMGQGIWLDSENLGPDGSVAEVIKHGTLSCGFIGLAECLIALIGKHHGESDEAQELGLKIIGHMRDRMDEQSKKTGLNFTLLGTPAESLSGRFIRLDKQKYGVIPKITDRDYYTNSSHVPVYYPTDAYHKIDIEAPYHKLENAGHISYIELDGDVLQNTTAFERIIQYMKEKDMGYVSINHASSDRDPVCGFVGVIGDTCPCCGRSENDGNGPKFERLRRITGYLVGTLDRWNNAKRAEERDRVKHGV